MILNKDKTLQTDWTSCVCSKEDVKAFNIPTANISYVGSIPANHYSYMETNPYSNIDINMFASIVTIYIETRLNG